MIRDFAGSAPAAVAKRKAHVIKIEKAPHPLFEETRRKFPITGDDLIFLFVTTEIEVTETGLQL